MQIAPDSARADVCLHAPGASSSVDAVSRSSDALSLVRKHGKAWTSFHALGKNMHHWIHPDACVAYAETGGSWVVAGGPISAEAREIEVMERFAEAARQAKKRVRFFGLERDVSGQSSFATLHIGEQPVWNPAQWPNGVRKKLRDQIRRAQAKGDIVLHEAGHAELSDPASATRQGLDTIIATWLDSRRMAPMGFLVELDPFHLAAERRFFIATQHGRTVGALVAVPLFARQGWFFDQMLRLPDAPNCTVELLFDFAMRKFAEEQSPHVTFGLSPLSGSGSWVLRLFRERATSMYNFKGLHNFKAKLGPQSWEPVYLAYPKSERGVSAVFDACSAFTPRGLLRFGLDTLLRRTRLRLPPRAAPSLSP